MKKYILTIVVVLGLTASISAQATELTFKQCSLDIRAAYWPLRQIDFTYQELLWANSHEINLGHPSPENKFYK